MKKILASVLHLTRDGLMRLFSFFGFSRAYRESRQEQGPLTRIVVFHDIPQGGWFPLILAELVHSYHVLTPEEFMRGERHSERLNVLITFDDGYCSWIDVALPALAAHNVKALFFVSSRLLDVSHDKAKTATFMHEHLHIKPRPALTWSGVRALHAAGHTIGGHGSTHVDLTKLTPEALRLEIEEDKEALENALKTAVTEFAYPFGTRHHVNDSVVEAVRAVGYARAYTAMSRFVEKRATFRIPRMCIETGLPPRSLKYWMNGSYDLFDSLKQLFIR